MTVTIPLSQVQFPKHKHLDEVGKVFMWKGRVFRAVFPAWESHVRSLFSTGFVDELMAQHCIPGTWITDYQLDGFPLVLEHEAIWPVIYPQEWTFSMLRDAALLVYNVARIAETYRLDMKDCHGGNVLFHHAFPQYCDLGSFVPRTAGYWSAYSEFLQCYYYPLRIWQHNPCMGKLCAFSSNAATHDTYLMYQHPFARRLSPTYRQKLINFCLLAPGGVSSQRPPSQQRSLAGPALTLKPRFKELLRGAIPVRRLELPRLVHEIEAMSPNGSASAYGNHREEPKDLQRFQRIIEIINGLEGKISSAIDLGGNQGRFASVVSKKTEIGSVICADSDHNAIDMAYNVERESGTGKITFANYDFVGCIGNLRRIPPTVRFRSDIAVALEVVQDLILSKKYEIQYVLESIADYAVKYVVIEFAPLGSWPTAMQATGRQWCTREWFRSSFRTLFDVLHEEKSGMDGLVLVGRVRNGLYPSTEVLRPCS